MLGDFDHACLYALLDYNRHHKDDGLTVRFQDPRERSADTNSGVVDPMAKPVTTPIYAERTIRQGAGLISLWRKERAKPRVFLGTLAVVPREDVKWVLEDMFGNSGQEIEGHLHDQLQEIFALAPASTADPVLKTDLGVDIYLPKHYGGESIPIELGDWTIWLIPLALLIPLFWRPKIELKARLYRLHDRKLVKTFTVRERPTYRECCFPDFSWRGMFGLKPRFGDSETARLLDRASLRLLKRIAAVAYA